MSVFKIEEIHGGWIDGYIEDQNNHIDFSYSYITDFLGDLLDAFFVVLNNERKSGIVCTEIEPGADFWKITYADNKMVIGLFLYEKHKDFISTIEYDPDFKEKIDKEDEDYRFSFEKEEFISNFMSEIENNIDEYNNNYLKPYPNNSRTTDDLKRYCINIRELLSKN